MSELTTRQWELYNLLKDNPERVFKQIDICLLLPDRYEYDGSKNFHDSSARLQITDDIRAINKSTVVEKIIIQSKQGVKLATEEEYENFIAKEYAAIFRKLERTRQKERKARLDGQRRIVFGREKDTVEAFTDTFNHMKAARQNKGLRLSDVAKELKKSGHCIDKSLLSKMENGICKPTDSVAFILSDIYGVSFDYLLG